MHKTGREARNAFRPVLFCGGTEKKGKKRQEKLAFGEQTCENPRSNP